MNVAAASETNRGRLTVLWACAALVAADARLVLGIPVVFHWVLALFLRVLGGRSSVSMGACSKGEPA